MNECMASLKAPDDQELYYEIVSHHNIRRYSHQFSPILLPNSELSKEDTDEHGEQFWRLGVEGYEGSTLPATERNWEEKSDLPQEGKYQLVVQSPLKPYIQVTLYGLYRLYRNMHIYANTHMHHIKVILKGHEFKREGRGYMGGFTRRKGMGIIL